MKILCLFQKHEWVSTITPPIIKYEILLQNDFWSTKPPPWPKVTAFIVSCSLWTKPLKIKWIFYLILSFHYNWVNQMYSFWYMIICHWFFSPPCAFSFNFNFIYLFAPMSSFYICVRSLVQDLQNCHCPGVGWFQAKNILSF